MWIVNLNQVITAEQKAQAAKDDRLEQFKAAFDGHLDAVAQMRGYDNRLTIGTYAACPVYGAEANAFITFRAAALASMFAQLAEVEAGGPVPTIGQFLSRLPFIDWPE